MSAEVVVSELPMCDIHKFVYDVHDVLASYDAASTSGSWAYMCEECFATYGIGLGTGRGQRLILAAEQECVRGTKGCSSKHETLSNKCETW